MKHVGLFLMMFFAYIGIQAQNMESNSNNLFEVIPFPSYVEADDYQFKGELLKVRRTDIDSENTYGAIDKNGNIVIPCRFSRGSDFNNELYLREKQKRIYGSEICCDYITLYNLTDNRGNIILADNFLSIRCLSKGYLLASKQGEKGIIEDGVINKNGEIIVPFDKYVFGETNDGLTFVRWYTSDSQKMGYIDSKGKLVISMNLIDEWIAYRYGSGAIYPNSFEEYGLDLSFPEDDVIPSNLSWGYFSEGLAHIWNTRNHRFGYINKVGDQVIPYNFDFATHFYNGFAVAGNNNKYGVINKKGEFVVPCKYSRVEFSDSVAKVYDESGLYGFVNINGKIISPCQYSEAAPFNDGIAIVKKGNSRYAIDKNGEIVIDFNSLSLEDLGEFNDGFAWFVKGRKYGLIDKQGKIVLKPEFDYIQKFNEGIAVAYKHKEYAIDTPDTTADIDNHEQYKNYYLIKKKRTNNDQDGNKVLIEEHKPVNSKDEIQPSTSKNHVEVIPRFPYGNAAEWVGKQFSIPDACFQANAKGKEIVSFYIEKDGTIGDIRIERSVHSSVDEEIIRVLSKMPKWIPGTQDGEPVRVKYSLPFTINY